MILGRKFFTDWFIKRYSIMVVFFLSGINSFIFLPLNPAIYRIGNTPNILSPFYSDWCEEQDQSDPPFYLLLQDFQNYSRLIWTTKG